MNVFTLFNNKDLDSIKLGIEVIKTLGYQLEFEEYYGRSFDLYDYYINNIEKRISPYQIGNYMQLKYCLAKKFNYKVDLVRNKW